MQYAEGKPGRVFVMRVDHGEELLGTITQLLKEKEITSGMVFFLGAINEGKLVVGPEEPVIPPVPRSLVVEGGWELIGIGTVYPGAGGPAIHCHASAGRAGHAITGCLREFANVYLVIEVVILEFTGISASRILDPQLGLHIPVFQNGSLFGRFNRQDERPDSSAGPKLSPEHLPAPDPEPAPGSLADESPAPVIS